MKGQEELSELIDLICEDLGVRELPSDMQKMRFIKLLAVNWGFVTVEDISAAFEDYLFGRVDVAPHYGKFSSQFFISVIGAYIQKKSKSRIEQKAREMKSLPMSDEEKLKSRKDFLANITKSFNHYRETGEISSINLMWPVYNFFHKKELIDAQLTEGDELRAKQDVLMHMTNRKYENMDSKLVESTTKGKSNERATIEFYDKLIANNEQIEDYF